MRKIIYKSVENSVQDIDDKSRIVKNVFNRTDMVDSDGDLITPNAFNKTIKESGPQGKNLIVHLVDHIADHDHLVAKFSSIYMDGKNLVGVTKIPNTTRGNDILELYKTGNINQHSIGFSITKSDKSRKTIPFVDSEDDEDTPYNDDEDNEFRDDEDVDDEDKDDAYDDFGDSSNPYASIIREVRLYEGSSVIWGANDQTPNLSVGKSLKKMSFSKKMEHFESLMKSMENLYSVLHKGKISDDTGFLLQLRYIQLQDQLEKLFKSLSITQSDSTRSIEPMKKKEKVADQDELFKQLLIFNQRLNS